MSNLRVRTWCYLELVKIFRFDLYALWSSCVLYVELLVCVLQMLCFDVFILKECCLFANNRFLGFCFTKKYFAWHWQRKRHGLGVSLLFRWRDSFQSCLLIVTRFALWQCHELELHLSFEIIALVFAESRELFGPHHLPYSTHILQCSVDICRWEGGCPNCQRCSFELVFSAIPNLTISNDFSTQDRARSAKNAHAKSIIQPDLVFH